MSSTPPTSSSTGSYVLRRLVDQVPLSEGDDDETIITCVDLWENNLYVGTSAGEVLHFVALPSEADDISQDPSFIFASRLQPTSTPNNESQSKHGVQQILLLPSVGKACLLCNGTLSFHSLPELSPALRNAVVSNCSWVGGTDLNAGEEVAGEGVVLMICQQKRVRLVRISESVQFIRNIEYANCLVSARRNQFACVADSHSYALLDVENQQKINLFPISSLNDNASGGQVEDISFPERSSSLRPLSRDASVDGRGHGRQSSLGALVGGLGRRQGSPQSRSQERGGVETLEPPVSAEVQTGSSSHNRSISASDSLRRRPSNTEKPLPTTPELPLTPKEPAPTLSRAVVPLAPHVCSPTGSEFLLTTGTAPSEPGVGIFVNLDGDVVRGTLEFSQYPGAVVVDGKRIDIESIPGSSGQEPEGFVLATVRRSEDQGETSIIEVQRWDVDGQEKEWLAVPQNASHENANLSKRGTVGIRDVYTKTEVQFLEVGSKLRARRLPLSNKNTNESLTIEPRESNIEEWESKRNEQEVDFGRRLGARASRIVVWSGSTVWWAVRNPLVLKMDAAVEKVLQRALDKKTYIDRSQLITLINGIRGQEASTETDFLSLEYLRQKVSLILFNDLVSRSWDLAGIQSADKRITEGLLMEGAVDPRLIVTTFSLLRTNVFEGPKGLWIHAGLIETLQSRPWTRNTSEPERALKNKNPLDQPEIAGITKRYLQAWRQRKGFGSIADEVEVFKTVDAALLNVLLYLDRPHPARTPSIRAELYSVVDSGVDCLDRAVSLLETYHRLYVLSRLYQQRKMYRRVLETWVRIVEGARDDGGEFVDGENEIRKYLVRSRDPHLVDEYGVWLARRHPSLGVQVFTDDHRKVKTEPGNIVQLLRQKAPEAVKVYLEHLVFGKKSYQYANDLISYYLDSVLAVLRSSEEARSILLQSYKSYRALRPPKPTYRQFVVENAVPQSWWRERLRLLELLGGSHGSDFTYDVQSILERIEPFEEDLVPESIILDGRQGRHRQAIRLLVHGLGDFHTAVNYCLLGGASIFHPMTGAVTLADGQSRDEQVTLFDYLLTEFLRIEDFSDRLERTSELLERFGAWYDVRQVLELIPDSWSVELVSGFLIGALRRLVTEKSEAMIVKSLSGAENLQVASAFVEKCTAMGPQIERIE
ncbi:MAG: hypothetical protein Q9191_007312 [Dirinaria sp. TL-2023a]